MYRSLTLENPESIPAARRIPRAPIPQRTISGIQRILRLGRGSLSGEVTGGLRMEGRLASIGKASPEGA